MNAEIGAGDRVIAISRDDDTIVVSNKQPSIDEARYAQGRGSKGAERTLILGWNDRVPLIMRELDTYVTSGSELVSWRTSSVRSASLIWSRTDAESDVFVCFGDSTNRAVLESLQIHGFHHVLVVSYSERFSAQEATLAR